MTCRPSILGRAPAMSRAGIGRLHVPQALLSIRDRMRRVRPRLRHVRQVRGRRSARGGRARLCRVRALEGDADHARDRNARARRSSLRRPRAGGAHGGEVLPPSLGGRRVPLRAARRRAGDRARQHARARAPHARAHPGEHLPRGHRPPSRYGALVRADRGHALRGGDRASRPARANAGERGRAVSQRAREAALPAGNARGPPGALRGIGVRRRHERQAGEHPLVREALKPSAVAPGEPVRESHRRGHPSQARRDGRDPAIQPGAGAVMEAASPPARTDAPPRAEVRLGLGANLAQFSLLVVVNAFVGAMVGLERSILPAIAEQDFHLAARAAVLSFIVVFGITKALTNYLAGRFSDAVGRKTVLVAGWLLATPVPFLLMWAPTWGWVLFANVLLGVSQGLTWSTTVIMKIDLAGPERRGLAMGLNEFAGYLAVALSALATGHVAAAYGLRPQPFYLGVGFAVIGLGLSAILVRETHGHARHEARNHAPEETTPSQRQVFLRTSFTDRELSSVSQAGLVNNLNDGMAWGLFPLFFAAAGMSLQQIGWLAAIYPGVWGAAQLVTGALSDRIGRKWLIAGGMWVQAVGITVVVISSRFAGFAVGGVLLGVGTAMVYPTLLAAIGDVAHPTWRASSVGVYRLWRDLGYAVGALLAGVTADALGLPAAIWLVAALTFASGAVVALRMRETRRRAAT